MINHIRLYDLFFWTTIFFLTGVFIASFGNITISVISSFLLSGLLLFFNSPKFSSMALIFILMGATYYFAYNYLKQNPRLTLDKKIKIEEFVSITKQHLNYQEIVLNNKVKIITSKYPEFNYGDYITAEGILTKSKSPLLVGVISYPKINLIKNNTGNFIKTKLINLRLSFENNLKRVLPPEKAAFLSGLTVGNISGISKNFYDNLKNSGTTHLVALSGYNIIIIINALNWIFSQTRIRKYAFWLIVLFITGFVIMTGGEASLVRAAIMGTIVLVAGQSERIYSARNAIVAAAFIIVLYNPKFLYFDLGFQLSFLALLGIIYLSPLLKKITGWKNDLVWSTLSAQIAVLPLIIIKFGQFNLLSPIANLLIIPIMPYTMGLGFLTGITGFFSYNISSLIAIMTDILLTYEMVIINFFASYI